MAAGEDKIQLIEDGIQTIKFIQDNREQIQKTYGRSAIEGPATRERIIAWEEYISNPNGEDGPEARRGSSEEEGVHGSSSESNIADGSVRKKQPISTGDSATADKSQDHQNRDGENSSISSGRDRDAGGIKSRDDDRGGTSGPLRADESSRGISDCEIDSDDYDRILALDDVSKEKMETGNSPVKVEIRDATPADISQILSEDSSKTHKRLRGVSEIITQAGRPTEEGIPVKKGHRREYCIDVFGGKTYVREWCNPGCARITVEPSIQRCICGQCPERCIHCADE